MPRLVWTAALPERAELFDLSADPGEAVTLVDQIPELVRMLQDRIEAPDNEIAPAIVLMAANKATCGAAPIAADPSVLFSQGQD